VNTTLRRPMRNGPFWWSLPALLLLSGGLLHADEVTLDNGQTLKGRIYKFYDPDLFLSVHFADSSIPIRWNNVISLETTAPIRVELRDGRAFFANITMHGDGSVRLQEQGSEVPIETTRDQIFTMEERKGKLDGEVGISGTGSAGNTQAQSLRVYWDIYFRWETQDLQIKGEGAFDSTNGDTTGRSLYAQVRYDYRFDPFFVFASVEENIDRFADIESRFVSTVGTGTYLFNSPIFYVRADVGLTYTVSRLKVGEDSETPGYRPSLSLQWKLPWDIRLKDYATFYGNLDDRHDWQARNEVMLSREVFRGFHVNGGLTSVWDNGVVPGVSKRDDTYYFGIGYEF
jgi:putative salt-induced outer membrane protein YdiY